MRANLVGGARTPNTYFILEVPDAVAVGKVLKGHARLREDAHLKAGHVEQLVGVVLEFGGKKEIEIMELGGNGQRKGKAKT